MAERIIKFRCPACAGKIGIDEDYHRELGGKTVACPHCQTEVRIPAMPDTSQRNPRGEHGVDVTQFIETPRRVPPVPGSGESRTCPFCNEIIGPRDRVCIKCQNTLPSP
jgi:hypothetical protein